MSAVEPADTAYTSARIVRVPLPAELINRMDQLIVRGAGGYQLRADFIRDAIENLVAEMSYTPAPPEPAHRKETKGEPTPAAEPHGDPREPYLSDLEPVAGATALGRMGRVFTWASQGTTMPSEDPLFGLHNRDYPSLWAARRLGEWTSEGPMPWLEFERRIVAEAWDYGVTLTRLETATRTKLTGLFPTNYAKAQAAEGAFLAFAVGSPQRGGGLFAWRLAEVRGAGREARLALTAMGARLVGDLSELDLDLPHRAPEARAFLAHLREWAPGDYQALVFTLDLISHSPTRQQLLGHYRQRWPDWSTAQITTNAAGYVARCREWGLAESRLQDGRYSITDFGQHILEGSA